MATMGPTTARHVERLAGNVIRVARARTAMSQRDLARAAGIAQSTIARIESGARQPTLPVLARILAAVDMDLRIDLGEYDACDDVRDAEEAQLTAEERAARHALQDEFAGRRRTSGAK
jgi:transcriptional regulator with XRE-family HTH domain